MDKTLTDRDLRRANIPERYWEDVTLGRVPEAAYKDEVRTYLSELRENIEAGNGLYLWSGRNGTGKTALSTIILRLALMLGYTGFYIRTGMLQSAIIEGRMFDQTESVYDRVRNVDVLVLDDFGKEHKARSGFTESMIEDLVRERVQRAKTTIFTSNLIPDVDEVEAEYSRDLFSVLEESITGVQVVGSEGGGRDWREG